MKSSFSLMLLLSVFASFASGAVVSFNDLNGYNNSTPAGSYFDGYGAGATTGSWQTQGLAFNTRQFGPGWSYSNVNNTTTAGFTNQYASSTGTGRGGSGNYLMATGTGAFFNLPNDMRIESLFISNSTYANLSMRNGDQFAKKFGGTSGNDPDFFRVRFTGFNALGATGSTTGTVDFFLADFRNANNALDFIVTDWQSVDLSVLGNARSVGLAFDGSDVGAFGLNTPAYAAFDDFSLTAVPEPSGMVLLLCGTAALGFIRRRQPSEKCAVC